MFEGVWFDDTSAKGCTVAPPYSSFISYTKGIWEKMREKGWGVSINWGTTNDPYCYFDKHGKSFGGNEDTSTIELAVCVAAKAAMESEQG
jgi:hypothetical protein